MSSHVIGLLAKAILPKAGLPHCHNSHDEEAHVKRRSRFNFLQIKVVISLKRYHIRHAGDNGERGDGLMDRNTTEVSDKALLNVKEMCDYLGIGQTKARELLADPRNKFTVRIGNRLYAHKQRLDTWLINRIL